MLCLILAALQNSSLSFAVLSLCVTQSQVLLFGETVCYVFYMPKHFSALCTHCAVTCLLFKIMMTSFPFLFSLSYTALPALWLSLRWQVWWWTRTARPIMYCQAHGMRRWSSLGWCRVAEEERTALRASRRQSTKPSKPERSGGGILCREYCLHGCVYQH